MDKVAILGGSILAKSAIISALSRVAGVSIVESEKAVENFNRVMDVELGDSGRRNKSDRKRNKMNRWR